MKPNRILPVALTLLLSSFGFRISSSAAEPAPPLLADFTTPRIESRPWVWWMWTKGNVQREGITADFAAFKDAGVGGAMLMCLTGRMPAGPVEFFSPQWHELFRHSASEAQARELKLAVINSSGWGYGGGPWITPELGMQECVWSEQRVRGGERFEGVLPAPVKRLNFYRDAAVLAFPMPTGGRLNAPGSGVKLRGSLPGLAAALGDAKAATVAELPRLAKGQSHAIGYEFPAAVTARAVTLRFAHNFEGAKKRMSMPVAVSSSEDGQKFTPVVEFDACWFLSPTLLSITAALPETTAKFFRIAMQNPLPLALADIEISSAAQVHYWQPKSGRATVNEHAGEQPRYAAMPQALIAGELPAGAAVARESIVDLTDKISPEGKLTWDAPAGSEWVILRVGHTPTGKRPPAAGNATALECDKLSPAGMELHFRHYADAILAESGGKKIAPAFSALMLDSWELEAQTWTAAMPAEFAKRRGYSLLPWLPVLCGGRVVGTRAESERFLWDWRLTLSEMLRDHYFGKTQQLCHERGLQIIGEHGGRQQFMRSPVDFLSRADVPTGEFWFDQTEPRPDCKLAASAAHLYDRPLVGAEAWTGSAERHWREDPFSTKALGDRAFCEGINHVIIIRANHQPEPAPRPGLDYLCGMNFDRCNTWFAQSGVWLDYLARCQTMLRRGQFVADVCAYAGEGAPVPTGNGRREDFAATIPGGWDYDVCNTESLARFTVREGRLVLPHTAPGLGHRVLVLPKGDALTLGTLRELQRLAKAGATIVGPRPQRSPSQSNQPQADDEVRALASEMWGADAAAAKGETKLGAGRILWGHDLAAVLTAMDAPRDFEATGPSAAEVRTIHRRDGDTDIYFVSQQSAQPINVLATFRVAGKLPELWHPDTGRTERPAVFAEKNGRTSLPLRLDAVGSVFVIFRAAEKTAPPRAVVRHAASPVLSATTAPTDDAAPPVTVTRDESGSVRAELHRSGIYAFGTGKAVTQHRIEAAPFTQTLAEKWDVTFPPNLGAPASITLEKLTSLAQHPEFGVRHFSGTATYTTHFDLPVSALAETTALHLDLGEVKNLATVTVNGQPLGTLWKPPFRVNLRPAAKAGRNDIIVRVTNLWVNRLIGDEHLPPDAQWEAARYLKTFPAWWPGDANKPRESARITATTTLHYTAKDKLPASGLLGPVTVISSEVMTFKTQP